ncbi:MAG: restriction endonuclease [Xanthomonadaceae bacterium]|nr:restriction endonuclease [Xanthomonadaceae bacterium]
MNTITYVQRIRHYGLSTVRVIKGRDKAQVESEMNAQIKAWAGEWAAQIEQNVKAQLNAGLKVKDFSKAWAAEETHAMQRAINECDRILLTVLGTDSRVDFEKLKLHGTFSLPEPQKPKFALIPYEPIRSDPDFAARFGLLDRLSSSRRNKVIQEMDATFCIAHEKWSAMRDRLNNENAAAQKKHEQDMEDWRSSKANFNDAEARSDASVDALKKDYMDRDPQAVKQYCDLVLNGSKYPGWMEKEFAICLDSSNMLLNVDYRLPVPSDLPNTREVKYVESRKTFDWIPFSPVKSNARYDSVVYQIFLRTVHELFSSDACGAINSIVFNGWTEHTDPSTGLLVRACIISVQVNREDYAKLHLATVDPKACFRALKGIGAAELHGMVPVQPILSLNRGDSRFVPSHDVASHLKEGTNLASLGWEEFEHLIRQLFEKEFAREGSEVKVTQSSRDGGVDAVIFDPDPIRGGKIVIQAKRYTNTVGVSAVRDLYGTVLNEGASKGILVTTSSFGPDTYAFARNKPLTLLDGANLVYLLGKQGYKARIDLDEAKALGVSMQRFVGTGVTD